RPVGETKSERLDVRVVAATLRDLGKLVERGLFREDLYYRLNVVNLQAPPLRERGEDIIILARHFLNRFNRELNREKQVLGFSSEAGRCCCPIPGQETCGSWRTRWSGRCFWRKVI